MEPQYLENQPQTLCPKCQKLIRQPNFLIHEARCKGPIKQQSQIRAPSRLSSTRIKKEPSSINLQNPSLNLLQENEKIPCPNCSYLQSFAQLDTHPGQCPFKEVECSGCHSFYPINLIEDHEAVCPDLRLSDYSNSESGEDQPRREILIRPDFLRHRLQSQEDYDEENSPRLFRRSHNLLDRIEILVGFLAQLEGRQQKGMSKQEIEKLKIKKYIKKQEQQLCTVCYCAFEEEENTMELPCKHNFHPQCISKWLEKNKLCPICKQSCQRNEN